MKAARRWRSGDGAPLTELLQDRHLGRGFGVYLGAEVLRDGEIDVLPLGDFLARLDQGKVIPQAAR